VSAALLCRPGHFITALDPDLKLDPNTKADAEGERRLRRPANIPPQGWRRGFDPKNLYIADLWH
jgi:hypothetical protein